ncbi:hypothetical protein L596_022763 [Steinernema carpocapsae]|uniref:Uncharacterized protein n=1 Tax=Steinernema carpocapsae TaxID=34508 RepID=A0A4V6A0C0_STECR|nr:hypothetical protein L596_022763 [Steinernema carpocapsae]
MLKCSLFSDSVHNDYILRGRVLIFDAALARLFVESRAQRPNRLLHCLLHRSLCSVVFARRQTEGVLYGLDHLVRNRRAVHSALLPSRFLCRRGRGALVGAVQLDQLAR